MGQRSSVLCLHFTWCVRSSFQIKVLNVILIEMFCTFGTRVGFFSINNKSQLDLHYHKMLLKVWRHYILQKPISLHTIACFLLSLTHLAGRTILRIWSLNSRPKNQLIVLWQYPGSQLLGGVKNFKYLIIAEETVSRSADNARLACHLHIPFHSGVITLPKDASLSSRKHCNKFTDLLRLEGTSGCHLGHTGLIAYKPL